MILGRFYLQFSRGINSSDGMKDHLSLRLVEIDRDGEAGGLAYQLVVHLGESYQVGVTPVEFPNLRIP